MVVVKKRDAKSSVEHLRKALLDFIHLLEDEKEEEAVEDLRIAYEDLGKFDLQTSEFKAAISIIHEAFEDKHELMVYAQPRKEKDGKEGWSAADELYLSSVRVLSLSKRFS